MSLIRFNTFLILFGLLLLSHVSSKAQQILFTIERSLNKDQIVYFLNLDENGHLEKENPISLKWLDNEKTGELVPIDWIKKKYGYGIVILSQEAQELTFKFVSYDEKLFILKKDLFGNYEVFAKINDRMMKIRHVYLKIDDGSFWKPNIAEVSVLGVSEFANTEVKETFNP